MRTPHQSAYVRLAQIVGKEMLEMESSLLATKLYDNRYTNPVDATQMFLDGYVKTHKYFWAKAIDISESVNKPGVRERKLLSNKPSVVTALWHGRQTADSIGCRYETYVFLAFEYLLSEKIWQRLPRPNQIYSEDVKQYVAEKWRGTKGLIPMPEDSRFQISEFSDTSIHRMFRDDVVNAYMQKQNSYLSIKIGCNLLQMNRFSEAQVEEAFGKDLLEQARRTVFHEDRPEAPRGLSECDFLPSCYGVPYAKRVHTCLECGVADACKSAAVDAVKCIIESCGDEDPKLQRKREQATERQRKKRERDREKRQRDKIKSV